VVRAKIDKKKLKNLFVLENGRISGTLHLTPSRHLKYTINFNK